MVVVDISRSRMKQTISSRRESHARVQTFVRRKYFTQACNEESCKLSTPVSTSPWIRFSKRSKNASSYPVLAWWAISRSEIEIGGGAGVKRSEERRVGKECRCRWKR